MQKFRVIEKAINAYILEYRRLPCPAGIRLTTSDSRYGEEMCEGNEKIGVNLSNAILVGTVPVDSLNLERRYIFDGWNNKIVYLVVMGYTDSENALFSNSVEDNRLINSKFSYALISHGRNKIGGIHYDDSEENLRLLENATEGEKKNIFRRIVGNVIQEFKDTQKFDDIVSAQNKENIIQSLDMVDAGCLIINSDLSNSIESKCGHGFGFGELPSYINYRDKKYSNMEMAEEGKTIVEKRCVVECGGYGKLNVYLFKKEI
jgi:hypothetical protein